MKKRTNYSVLRIKIPTKSENFCNIRIQRLSKNILDTVYNIIGTCIVLNACFSVLSSFLKFVHTCQIPVQYL
jgi:hypothetical protein